MDTLKMTTAYVATVGPDHTIILPNDVPVGATIAVIVMPPTIVGSDGDEARRARFAETLAATRAAMADEALQPTLSDAEVDELVERARKTPRA